MRERKEVEWRQTRMGNREEEGQLSHLKTGFSPAERREGDGDGGGRKMERKREEKPRQMIKTIGSDRQPIRRPG